MYLVLVGEGRKEAKGEFTMLVMEEDTDEEFDSEEREEEKVEEQQSENRDDYGHGEEERDDEEQLISDPLSDPQEHKALTSALSSYFLYRCTAHLNLTHQRRKGYLGLPRQHRDILEQAMRLVGGRKGEQ